MKTYIDICRRVPIVDGKLDLPAGSSIDCDLDLRGTAITALPDNLSVGGDLDLSGTAITNLPKTAKIRGNVYGVNQSA